MAQYVEGSSGVRYKSRAQRDRVQDRGMNDPRLAEFTNPKKVPFDAKRMICGGFQVVVGL